MRRHDSRQPRRMPSAVSVLLFPYPHSQSLHLPRNHLSDAKQYVLFDGPEPSSAHRTPPTTPNGLVLGRYFHIRRTRTENVACAGRLAGQRRSTDPEFGWSSAHLRIWWRLFVALNNSAEGKSLARTSSLRLYLDERCR